MRSLVDRIDQWAWIALALIGLECLVLLLFKMACPLTVVARRYSDSQASQLRYLLA
jgi:hypothetical protein